MRGSSSTLAAAGSNAGAVTRSGGRRLYPAGLLAPIGLAAGATHPLGTITLVANPATLQVMSAANCVAHSWHTRSQQPATDHSSPQQAQIW
jgi:hypothetical protein